MVAPTGLQPTLVRHVLFDLLDGAPAANVRLEVSIGDSAVDGRYVSDSAGAVELPAGAALGSGVRAEEPYVVVAMEPSGTTTNAIWVHRWVTVEGRVYTPNTDTLSAVAIEALLLPGGPGITPGRAQAPWSQRWLAAHGLFPRRTPARLTADGEFSIRMPAVRGLVVHARPSSDDLAPLARRVEVPRDADVVHADLQLRLRTAVTGRVYAPLGDQVSRMKVTVSLFVGRHASLEEQDVALQNLTGGQGVTFTGREASLGGGDLTFVTSEPASTDGSFAVPFHESGRAMLLVEATGCLNEEIRLGTLTDSRSGIEVHLRRIGTAPTFRLLDAGRPVTGCSLTVVDGDQEVGQSAYGPYRVSDEGRCTVDRLQVGRTYLFLVQEAPSPSGGGSSTTRATGWLRWTGQSVVDVRTDLRRDRDR